MASAAAPASQSRVVMPAGEDERRLLASSSGELESGDMEGAASGLKPARRSISRPDGGRLLTPGAAAALIVTALAAAALAASLRHGPAGTADGHGADSGGSTSNGGSRLMMQPPATAAAAIAPMPLMAPGASQVKVAAASAPPPAGPPAPMAGPAAADPPSARPAAPRQAPWECSGDGEDCEATRCCSSGGSRCYRRDAGRAACGKGCEAAQAAAIGDASGGNWSCEVLSEEAKPMCSWEEENCALSTCCRRVGFKCFEKHRGVAHCGNTCDEARKKLGDKDRWTCRSLGGDVGVRKIEPSKTTPAGLSLFCFAVITPEANEGSEQRLLDLMKWKKASIFSCDASQVLHGAVTERGDWNSVANTEVFLKAWQEVEKQGTYRQHDFTVKVDADAVFLPGRLREHLAKLRPPAAAPLYFHNIDFKFRFMGALEVLSAKAVDELLKVADKCRRSMGLKGGEDFFTAQCLDAAYVGQMSDFSLLRDKYTDGPGWDMYDISPCADPAFVAYHPFKMSNAWEGCYNVAMSIHRLKDYVGCAHRWKGDACVMNSAQEHPPGDAGNNKGVIRW